MKRIILSALLSASIFSNLYAQDENDALRYSTTMNFGTARGMSIGSALGSVGGDFSTISVNPAGIGIYRKSEFTFTPNFLVNGNDATYLNNSSRVTDNKFNFSEFGLVLSKTQGEYKKASKWKASSFCVGMNRLQNFSNRYVYSGINKESSIVNKWANDFNALGGLNQNSLNMVNFPAYAAYEVYLIDKDPGDSSKAKSYVPIGPDGIRQTKTVTEKGGMNEYVIAAGGNYMDKLMLGASLGIVSSRYERTIQYEEEDLSGDNNNDFKYLNFNETLNTDGTGFNLKLGAIYKFNKNFRLGVAFHTPTHIEFTDQSRISMQSNTESLLTSGPITNFNQDTAQAFNYSMNTPYRAIISATYLLHKSGFVTADIEFVDYGSMKYDFGTTYASLSNSMNNVIQQTYQSTANIRLGAEVKLEDFYLRGGYGFYGSPYVNANWNSTRQNATAGIGYRAKNWFLDMAFVHSRWMNFENPYVLTNLKSPEASITKKSNIAAFTMGWKL
jgi:hypothetical protein